MTPLDVLCLHARCLHYFPLSDLTRCSMSSCKMATSFPTRFISSLINYKKYPRYLYHVQYFILIFNLLIHKLSTYAICFIIYSSITQSHILLVFSSISLPIFYQIWYNKITWSQIHIYIYYTEYHNTMYITNLF
jgi:hypothetical protein